ncbi:Uu.00g120820.m01.CDS01 [Anthostomella pinea]|uniref:Uu.00g120820.m01.CDS01 n=1 Tax=Anthostomella pinea TaxID=933095 RepID=A0AAI8VGT4_9PEZI|nr:Uu.00g120820.m01.CDS01 [Anthostomella pinea]
MEYSEGSARTSSRELAVWPAVAPLRTVRSVSRKRAASEMSASAENLASASEVPHYVPTTGVGDVASGDGHSSNQGAGHSSTSNYDGATLTGTATSNNGAEGISGNVDYPPLNTPDTIWPTFPRPDSPTPTRSLGHNEANQNWPFSGDGAKSAELRSEFSYTEGPHKHSRKMAEKKAQSDRRRARLHELAHKALRASPKKTESPGRLTSPNNPFAHGHIQRSNSKSLFAKLGKTLSPRRGESMVNAYKGQNGHQSRGVVTQGSVRSVQRIDTAANFGSARSRTQDVLTDARGPSHAENRTSLMVSLPSGVSPLDQHEFDAGCGGADAALTPNSHNRFQSPSTPGLITVHAVQNASRERSSSRVTASTLANLGLKKWFVYKEKTIWLLVGATGVFVFISLVGSITSISVKRNGNDDVYTGDYIWVAISVGGTFFFMVILSQLICRREHLMKFRQATPDRAARDEEWVEMAEQPIAAPAPARLPLTNNNIYRFNGGNVPPIEDELAHRSVLRRTDAMAQNAAWDAFASNKDRMRRYVEYLEQHVDQDKSKNLAAGANEPIVQEQQLHQRIITEPAPIGVARSDSIYAERVHRELNRKHQLNKHPSVIMSASEVSIAGHEEFSPVPHAQQGDDDGNSSFLELDDSEGEEFHDVASIDADSAAGRPLADTHSISDYTSEVGTVPDSPQKTPMMYSPLDSMNRFLPSSESFASIDHPDPLRSNPTPTPSEDEMPISHLRSHHAITTEAGTPDSQKTDRYASFVPMPTEPVGQHRRHHSWSSPKDSVKRTGSLVSHKRQKGPVRTFRDMTPIKERTNEPNSSPAA